jgi:hypothetical protein
VGSINTEPPEDLLDLPQAYTVIVQQGRQIDRLAIHPLTLENSISSSISANLGRFGFISFTRSRIFPFLSLSQR